MHTFRLMKRLMKKTCYKEPDRKKEGIAMSEKEVKKCSKCGGEMAESSEKTFGDVLGCTRRESKKPEEQRIAKIQPYYCKGCGFIELYKEK